MAEKIDLTPLEPVLYDGTWKRDTLRAEMKRFGYDYRDFPEVQRGIEVLSETRIQTPPDKRSFTALDKHGEPLRGAYPMRRLAQELAAQIESERDPSVEDIMAWKRADAGYQL